MFLKQTFDYAVYSIPILDRYSYSLHTVNVGLITGCSLAKC